MRHEIWYQHALINRLQTLMLLLAMGAFLAIAGWLLWGVSGAIWLLFLALVLLILNPVVSPQLIMRLYRASRLNPRQVPALYAALIEIARRADLPAIPTLYYVPSRIVNAFALGTRSQAAIAVTDGLLRMLTTREAAGVLAHEVSHINSNDLRVMGIADLFSRMTSMLSLFGQLLLLVNLPLILLTDASINWIAVLILIFAPNLSALAQLGLSRTREYDADLNAAHLTGDPQGLASALMKIERQQGYFLERILLPGRRNPEPSLLRTHPPTEERVRRLMALELPRESAQMYLEPRIRFLLEPEFGDPIRRIPRWHISGLWH